METCLVDEHTLYMVTQNESSTGQVTLDQNDDDGIDNVMILSM